MRKWKVCDLGEIPSDVNVAVGCQRGGEGRVPRWCWAQGRHGSDRVGPGQLVTSLLCLEQWQAGQSRASRSVDGAFSGGQGRAGLRGSSGPPRSPCSGLGPGGSSSSGAVRGSWDERPEVWGSPRAPGELRGLVLRERPRLFPEEGPCGTDQFTSLGRGLGAEVWRGVVGGFCCPRAAGYMMLSGPAPPPEHRSRGVGRAGQRARALAGQCGHPSLSGWSVLRGKSTHPGRSVPGTEAAVLPRHRC